MFEIARTKELIETAQRLLYKHELTLAKNPESNAAQLMVASATSRVQELTNRLIEQQNSREFELVEIRLIGDDAKNGSLPLHMIGQLSNSFEETLVEIGKFAQHGSKKRKHAFTDTRRKLNAKLKRLGVGSTRLFISVDTNPDMYGNTLSEICISRTFELLHSKNPEEIIETSAIVGKTALRTINRFLKSLIDFRLEADLNWFTPLDTDLIWKGSSQKIKNLHATLNELTEADPIELNFEGELVTQSLKGEGKFELISKEGIQISGSVPYDVLAYFVQVRIGSYCRVKVIQTVITNQQTGKSKSFYELREIESIKNDSNPDSTQLSLFETPIYSSKILNFPPTIQVIEVPKDLIKYRQKIGQFKSEKLDKRPTLFYYLPNPKSDV